MAHRAQQCLGRQRNCLWLCSCCILSLASQVNVANGCIVFETFPAGFAVNVRILASTVAYYESNGTLYIDERSWGYTCRHTSHVGTIDQGWSLLFRGIQPKPLPLEGYEICTRVNHEFMLSIFRGIESWRTEEAGLLTIWQPAPFLLSAAANALTELKQGPAPFIVFHIRGGDKYVEDMQLHRKSATPKALVEAFQKMQPSLQGGSCLLIGDDSSLILEAQELAQTKLGCHVMTRGAQTGVLLAT
ncbi:TPA: hypothetical protein ACH3X2_002555 [Trebouxia sp. C0005]